MQIAEPCPGPCRNPIRDDLHRSSRANACIVRVNFRRIHLILIFCLSFGTFFPCFPATESPIAIACLRLLTTPPLPPLPRFSTPFLECASPSRRSLTHLLNTSSPLGFSYAVKSAPHPTPASVGPSSSASLPLSAHSSGGAIVENSCALEGDCSGSQDSFCVTRSSQAWRSSSQAISSCSIDCTILFMAASSIGFKGALVPFTIRCVLSSR